MKETLAYKCEWCGGCFADEDVCAKHEIKCKIDSIKEKAAQKLCEMQITDKETFNVAVTALKEATDEWGDVPKEYPVFSYGFGRWLDDGGSPFYTCLIRLMCICKICWKKHDQPYNANHCNHIT